MARALTRASEEGGGAVGVPEQLAEAGLAALAEVIAGVGARASAVRLLAADALLTFACEAAAEEGGGALERLTEALAPDRFAALLEAPR